MIFVDTGIWYAAFVPSDPDHAAAVSWFRSNTSPLFTTDYILDELFTLLLVRREIPIAMKIGPLFPRPIRRSFGIRLAPGCASGLACLSDLPGQSMELHRLC